MLTPDIRAKAEAAAEEVCTDKWMDKGEPVCNKHGFLWEEGQPHCNDEAAEFIYIISEMLKQIDNPPSEEMRHQT